MSNSISSRKRSRRGLKRLWRGLTQSWSSAYSSQALLVSLSPRTKKPSYALINLLGYVLLLSSLVDYIYILYPPRFTNFTWEFETMGRMVENVWALLLGFVLVFFRPQTDIRRGELRLLAGLRWIAFLLGLIFLLMLPLGIINTKRVDDLATRQFAAQLSNQTQQLQTVQSRLEGDLPPALIERLAASLNLESEQATREELINRVEQQQQTIRRQLDATRKQRRRQLLQRSAKWNIGNLVAGVSFLWFWRLTRWIPRALNE